MDVGPGRARAGGQARRRRRIAVREENGVRILHLGGDAIQSAMRLADPDALELAYTQAMMAFLLFVPAPSDVLMVGLGGGSLARFIRRHVPAARTTVVEIDPRVLAAARSLFDFRPESGHLEVVLADAADYIPAHPASADVLLLDAFDDGESVASLCTPGFYGACRAALREGGLLVANLIAGERRFPTQLARIERTFGSRVLCLPAADRVNIIALAFESGPERWPIKALRRRASVLGRRCGLPFEAFVGELLAWNARTASHLEPGPPLRAPLRP